MNLNKAFFVGKVEGQPQITDNQGTKRAFFTFVVNNRVQGENGQWVNSPVRIPIYADDRKANLIEQYVVEDHQLLLECEYQNWMDNNQLQHTFKPSKADICSITLVGSPPLYFVGFLGTLSDPAAAGSPRTGILLPKERASGF
jgi:hypothetical protein